MSKQSASAICAILIAMILVGGGTVEMNRPSIALLVQPPANYRLLALGQAAFAHDEVVHLPHVVLSSKALGVFGIVNDVEFLKDGWKGGILQVLTLPRVNGVAATLYIEVDVFSTETGALRSYAWLDDISGWRQGAPSAMPTPINAKPFRGISFIDTNKSHTPGAYTYNWMRNANILVTILGYTSSALQGSLAQVQARMPRAEMALFAHMAHLRSLGLFEPTGLPLSAVVKGGSSLWFVKLRHCIVTHTLHTQFSTDSARGKYIVLILDTKDIGNTPGTFGSDNYFEIEDNRGRTFDYDFSASSDAADEYIGATSDLQPSFSGHEALVFDVAKDAKGLVVLVHPGLTFNYTDRLLFSVCD